MKIFVAGASGALGRPLVTKLVEKGHEVVGLTTKRPEVVQELGATPAVANAFDPQGLKEEVVKASPELIVHALTRIPHTAYLTPGRLKINDRLRIEGTKNLLEAARAAGTLRMIAESITFAFRGRSEENMQPLDRMGSFQRSVEAIKSLESQVLEFEGVVLRYGFFYGPGTSMEDEVPKAIKRRMMPIVGAGTGWWSLIHMDDAAAATVAAIEKGKAGETYNICDDEPILVKDALGFIAETIGAPKPLHLPNVGPAFARYYFNKMTGANNSKAKIELSWTPRFSTFKEGFQQTVRG
jgi:nucleoside-diphosphate-sugar epimerase